MKIHINDTNYPYYKKIYEIIWSHFSRLYPPDFLSSADPVQVLNRWELKSKSLAKKGLKAGLQDFISQIKDFPTELKSEMNNDLLINNLPSLVELQGTIHTTVSRVLKRKSIKTLEEFYIIKEEVIDLSSELSEENRKILDKCLTDFDSSGNKNGT